MSFNIDHSVFEETFGNYEERRLNVIKRFEDKGIPVSVGKLEDNDYRESGDFEETGKSFLIVEKESSNSNDFASRSDEDVNRQGTKVIICDSITTGAAKSSTHIKYNNKVSRILNNDSLIIGGIHILHKLTIQKDYELELSI